MKIEAAQAALYYDYFAKLFLETIPVPGQEYVKDLAARTRELFDTSSCPVKDALHYLEGSDQDSIQETLAVDRTSLCRGVDPEGLLPPYESFWSHATSEGLADVKQTYSEAHLMPSDNHRERPDYLGMELNYLAVLAQREHDERIHGDSEAADSDLQRRRVFLEKHLAIWLPHYCKAALPEARTPYFRAMLLLLPALFAED